MSLKELEGKSKEKRKKERESCERERLLLTELGTRYPLYKTIKDHNKVYFNALPMLINHYQSLPIIQSVLIVPFDVIMA